MKNEYERIIRKNTATLMDVLDTIFKVIIAHTFIFIFIGDNCSHLKEKLVTFRFNS